MPVQPHPSLQKVVLLHHYDFEGAGVDVFDRVGDAHGVVVGGAELDGAGGVLLDARLRSCRPLRRRLPTPSPAMTDPVPAAMPTTPAPEATVAVPAPEATSMPEEPDMEPEPEMPAEPGPVACSDELPVLDEPGFDCGDAHIMEDNGPPSNRVNYVIVAEGGQRCSSRGGHAFHQLADEYGDDNLDCNCSSAREPNVACESDPALSAESKWGEWLGFVDEQRGSTLRRAVRRACLQ